MKWMNQVKNFKYIRETISQNGNQWENGQTGKVFDTVKIDFFLIKEIPAIVKTKVEIKANPLLTFGSVKCMTHR